MFQNPILHIITASAVAAALAYFMYYRSQKSLKTRALLGILRFISVFVLLLLLFNPKIKKKTYESVKTGLPILIDNSSSIAYLGEETEVQKTYDFLKNHEKLNEHFDLSFFRFGSEINVLDSLDFSEGQTQITTALEAIEQMYKDTDAPILLLTDGNQTSGRDYTYYATQLQREVYPMVIGDTTNYPDLRIDKVTANRFSYLHNDFPVEIHSSLQGAKEATTEMQIVHNGQVIHKQTLEFLDGNTSLFTQIHLPANHLGLQTYEVRLKNLNSEKNTENNSQNFAVDVLDSSGKIVLVSDMPHPDIGAIKRSVEVNSFLEVEHLSVEEAKGKLGEYNLVILFQPAQHYDTLVREIEEQELHVLYITGKHANWDMLNQQQEVFKKRASTHSDAVQGELDPTFDLFLFENISFAQLPPLETQFGMLEINLPHNSVLEQFVSGQRSGTSLMAIYEENSAKRAILDAEGIWRWRAAIYEREKSFQNFDSFFQALVQYLVSTQQKKRLQVHFENFYYQNTNVKLRAQYFDSNFQLNRNANLDIQISKKDSLIGKTPLIPSGLYQEIGLENLEAGHYSFTITEANSGEKAKGSFEILAYDIEQKFTRANIEDLQKLAKITDGSVLFFSDIERFIEELLENKKYQIKEREIVKEEPLVSYTFLLAILLTSLAIEWFLRKYHGML